MDGFLPDYKVCKICKQRKPKEEFYLNSYAKDGLTSRCKICASKIRPGAHFRYRYGITIVQYELMLKSQNGVCLICGQPETRKHNGKVMALSVDHCHKTCRIRGLLCDSCNVGLGRLETKELLESAIKYLERSKT